MSVINVPVQMEVGKESKEVLDCVFAIVEDIRAGKPVAQIAAENLPALFTAVEGFDKLDDEAKSPQRSGLAAYAVKKSMDAFLPVAPSA